MKAPKRKLSVHVWSDYSGARLYFDLIGKKKMLRAIVGLPGLECDVIDRHCKIGVFHKGNPCDTFRKCHLSIADYRILAGRNLKDIGIDGLFKILEEIWERDKNTSHKLGKKESRE